MKTFLMKNQKIISTIILVFSFLFLSIYIYFMNSKITFVLNHLYDDTIGTYVSKQNFSKESEIFITTLKDKNPLCFNALKNISYQYKDLMNDHFYRYMYYGNDDFKDIEKLKRIENNYISLNCPIEELLVVENIYNMNLLKIYKD